MMRLVLSALTLWLTCATGRAQVSSLDLGSGGTPGQDFAVLSKLFGKIPAFSAKSEVRVLDKNQKETISLVMDFAMLDKSLRMEVDAAKIKNRDLPEGTIDGLRQMGLDKFVTLIRPARKSFTVIYPKLSASLTMPLKPEDLEAAEKSSVKTEVLGQEKLDGHACVKHKVTITPLKGPPQSFTVWNATDLKDFPIQTLAKQGDETVVTRYTGVQLNRPEAKQFESPAGFQEFKSVNAFTDWMRDRASGGGAPTAR